MLMKRSLSYTTYQSYHSALPFELGRLSNHVNGEIARRTLWLLNHPRVHRHDT